MLTQAAPRQSVNLQEHIQSNTSGNVDRAGGVIRNVKILGKVSKNGREYSDQAMRQAAAFYEGIGVNANHPDKSVPGRSRSVDEAVGWLQNIKVRSDGVYGDLCVLKSHPLSETIFEAAERKPNRLGLSHNAEGSTVQRGGKTIVESIKSVRSVDLVQNPATNSSLFESVDPMTTATKPRKSMATLRRNISILMEDKDLRPETKARVIHGWLAETMDGAPMAVDGPMPDPCADLKAAIRAELTKPGVDDETKIAAVFAIIGVEDPSIGDAMAESYGRDFNPYGSGRRQQDILEGASAFRQRIGERPLPGTNHAAKRAAAVQAFAKRYR